MERALETTAYVALGANLGDRDRALRNAVEHLCATPGIALGAVSSFLGYPAVGGPPDSPPFLNAAVELRTSLTARALLDRLLAIEHLLGRERREKWGPRTIDLDLLLYGDHILHEPGLIVPHPLLHERRFVLEPLAQIAAQAIHPGQRMTVGQLLGKLT